MTDPGRDGIPIRSFRVVFDLERRIHKIDRMRLPLPYGLPLRSIAYALTLLIAVAAASRLPVAGVVLHLAPLPVRVAVLPAVGAYLLTQLHPDGRPAHWFLLAWLTHRLGVRRYVAFTAAAERGLDRLADVGVAPDERGPTLRAGFLIGPVVALLRQPVRATAYGTSVVVEQTGHETLFRGQRLVLGAGQRARVRTR